MKLPPGYKVVEAGYKCLYEMDFTDMFEAFETPNRGVIGGQRTVDDYTPDGLADFTPAGLDDKED